jgi:hypothetical protein
MASYFKFKNRHSSVNNLKINFLPLVTVSTDNGFFNGHQKLCLALVIIQPDDSIYSTILYNPAR